MAETVTAAFLVFVSLLFTVLLLLSFCRRGSRASLFLSQFPGPPRLPIIGCAKELIASNQELTRRGFFVWPELYGPRYGMEFIGRSYFTSLKHNDIEKLLSSPVAIQKGHEYDFMKDWLGEGLLISTGAKWFKRRKLLTPAFHFKILEQFMSVFNEQAKVFVDILHEDTDAGRTELEITQYISRFTLDVICETAMGRRIDAQRVKTSAYIEAVLKTNKLLIYRTVRPWFYTDFAWYLSKPGRRSKQYLDILHGFTTSVIRERKQEIMSQLSQMSPDDDRATEEIFMGPRKRHVAFLDLLIQHQLENPGELSDEDMRQETDTFMFEGHDTTAASLSWTVYLLGAHPTHLAKVYEELCSIFGDAKDRPVTSQDLTQMKYLECCIKEALRLYPSVPFIGRYLTEDLHVDEDTTVPAGMDFSVLILKLHRDPKMFPDPEKFDPERFFPENSAGRHPFAFIPFSAGPRNCIGQRFALMEEKVVLAYLFRKYHVESLDKPEDIVLTTDIITRPKNGFRIKLTPRV